MNISNLTLAQKRSYRRLLNGEPELMVDQVDSTENMIRMLSSHPAVKGSKWAKGMLYYHYVKKQLLIYLIDQWFATQ